jgi:SAM-dependent methyltransferase
MTIERSIAQHYAHGDLERAIVDALVAMGKNPEQLTIEDLAPVDEFHIGGRKATTEFMAKLGLGPDMRVLDVGSGLGGPARFAAHSHGCHVTGIDLTPEYVEVAKAMARRVGLDQRVTYVSGSAIAMPFPAASFDAAYMLHVGMNIENKAKLMDEVRRVLKPGAVFGVYDVMRTGDGDLAFPVPWARSARTSFVVRPGAYRRRLDCAGFDLAHERDRSEFALEFFRDMRARVAEKGTPPLGLHIVMGKDFQDKTGNMIANLERKLIAPIEMIGRSRAASSR